MFARISGDALAAFDKDIADQLKSAIKSLKGKVDAEFYGLQDLLADKKVEVPP